jgi:FkbM family methyltransferase
MIYHYLKRILKKLFNLFGLGLIRSTELVDLRSKSAEIDKLQFDINFLVNIDSGLREIFLKVHSSLNSDLRQDFMALNLSGMKKNGYFVEIGAADGLFASNTLTLEKNYGWKGILVEPAKSWHKNLRKNRSCTISTLVVSNRSGEQVDFYEAEATNLSTIEEYINFDSGALHRKKFKKYKVESISLLDLLTINKAPTLIDYLSVDTEGSEFLILRDFDFSRFRFKFISVEHNYNPNRGKINELLTGNGYEQIYENISQYDDWYKLIGS